SPASSASGRRSASCSRRCSPPGSPTSAARSTPITRASSPGGRRGATCAGATSAGAWTTCSRPGRSPSRHKAAGYWPISGRATTPRSSWRCNVFLRRAQLFEARVDGHGVVVIGVFCIISRPGFPQFAWVEVAHEEGRADAANVDPAQDGLGTPPHEDQLGDTAKLELADPVAVDNSQSKPDFSSIVHFVRREAVFMPLSLLHD